MFANSDNGGGTDWAQKSVPQMWSMLAAHDGTAHKNLLLTWKKSTDLLVDHLSRVKRYRDNLAEAWPPEKSSAAAKYLDRLDDLIKHLTETHHATVENHRALGAATSALVGARLKIESIYRAYMSNQQELDAYAQKQQTNRQVVGKYRAIAPVPPVVAQSRQLELQLQAQSVMSALSTDLAQAQLSITTPKLYDPTSSFEGSQPFGPKGTEASSSTSSPSFSEQKVSGMASKNRGSTDPRNFASESPDLPTPRTLPPDSSTPALPPAAPAGPILSGVDPGNIGPGSSQTLPTTPRGEISSPVGLISIPPVAESISFSPGPSSTRTATSIPIESSGPSTRGIQGTLPGGVIGGPPSTNSTRSGESSGRAQRINPAGGVIGQPGSIGTPLPSSNRLSSSHKSESRKQHWDPDNPWTTAEGISPVLLPPEKEHIDPGPAIGLP
jgi:hypothetical protein